MIATPKLQQGVLNVRFSFSSACVLAAALVVAIAFPQAARAEGNGGTGVVVIDIKYIFDNHARFKQSTDLLKRDAEEFQSAIRAREKGLREKTEQAKDFNPGTPEYKKVEEEVAKLASDLQVEMALKRKEFMEREAKLLYTTYTEISDRVARFADENGISLVLRFDSSAINADDRGSVQAGINRSIIYQRQLDITLAVLEQCNRDKPAAGPAATGPGGAAPKSAVRPPVGAQRKLK
jgi:Skp family chaperone for outer membrane proteins